MHLYHFNPCHAWRRLTQRAIPGRASLFLVDMPAPGERNIDIVKLERQRLAVRSADGSRAGWPMKAGR